MNTQLEDLLTKANEEGGKILANVVLQMHQAGIIFPAEESDAYRIRGVGYTSLVRLKRIGAVKDEHLTEYREVYQSSLSTRAKTILINCELPTRGEALEALKLGRLKPGNWKTSVRACGRLTYQEICRWAGFVPQEKPKSVRICPHCGKDVHAKV